MQSAYVFIKYICICICMCVCVLHVRQFQNANTKVNLLKAESERGK